MKVKKLLKSSVSILLVLCMTFSMVVVSGTIASAAETTAESVGAEKKIEVVNGITYTLLEDLKNVDKEGKVNENFFLDALQQSNQFENWASVMYSILNSVDGHGYASGMEFDFNINFGYGTSKWGYSGNKKNRNHGRLVHMVDALKGNDTAAIKHKDFYYKTSIKSYFEKPKMGSSPQDAYDSIMNLTGQCNNNSTTQSKIEENVDLSELKNLQSSSKVVFSTFAVNDVDYTFDADAPNTTAMGLMFYNINIVPLYTDIEKEETKSIQAPDSFRRFALVNNGVSEATLSGGLSNSKSLEVSHSKTHTDTGGWHFNQKITNTFKFDDVINFFGIGKLPGHLETSIELGMEEFYEGSDSHTDSETTVASTTNDSNFETKVPSHAVSVVEEAKTENLYETEYDGPAVITYDVAMYSLGVRQWKGENDCEDGTSFFATFTGIDDTAPVILNKVQNGTAGFNVSFKDGKDQKVNTEAIRSKWQGILNTEVKDKKTCANYINAITGNQPMIRFKGVVGQNYSDVTYQVKDNYSTEPIGRIGVYKSYENNTNYTKVTSLNLDKIGETKLEFDEIRAYTKSDFEFVGWTPTNNGYWVLIEETGNDSEEIPLVRNGVVSNNFVSVRQDSAGGIYVTPIKKGGQAYLKFKINDYGIKYFPYQEGENYNSAILMDSAVLRDCTNADIPKENSGMINLAVNSGLNLDKNRVGIESKMDGEGSIELDTYAAKPGETINITVDTGVKHLVENVVAQVHNDPDDHTKYEEQETTFVEVDAIKGLSYYKYTVPENSSKVTIVAKTASKYVQLKTEINNKEGNIALSNYNPKVGEQVNIAVSVPNGYYLEEVVAMYPADKSKPNSKPEIEKISDLSNLSSVLFSKAFTKDATIIAVITPNDEENKIETDSDGTFIIKNYEQLCKVAEKVNSGLTRYIYGNYVLANDIDCSNKIWTTSIGITKKIDTNDKKETKETNETNKTNESSFKTIPFAGTFDGNGHTIKNLNLGTSGLFGIANGAEIKNLKLGLIDTYSQTTDKYSGAICAELTDGKISNCSVTGKFKSVSGEDNYLGGIVGLAKNSTIEKCFSDICLEGSSFTKFIGGICAEIKNTTVTDCAFTNKISSLFKDAICGGIVGSGDDESTIQNSYFHGQFGETNKTNYTIGQGISAIKNCFYIYRKEVEYGTKQGLSVNEDQFKSGEVAYALNLGKTENQSWYQNLDNGFTPDKYPVLVNNDENTVYKVDREDRKYSNSLDAPIKVFTKINEGTIELSRSVIFPGKTVAITVNAPAGYLIEKVEAHYEDASGEIKIEELSGLNYNHTCTLEQKFYSDVTIVARVKKTFDTDDKGNFIIKNYEDLCSMAEKVNLGAEDFVQGSYIVANDIDCSGNKWEKPIGTSEKPFSGFVDGQGHTIKNLNMATSGLFGTVYSGDFINLNLDIPEYSIIYNDNGEISGDYSGALCGYAYNCIISNCSVTGQLGNTLLTGGLVGYAEYSTIEKCISDIMLTASENHSIVGGLCSEINDTTVTECAFINNKIKTTTTNALVGGIVGRKTGESPIQNSYFYGKFELAGFFNAKPICGSGELSIDNCYFIKGNYSDSQGTAMTEDQFKSGEVAYKLNKGVTDTTQGWYQSIDNGLTPDDYPVIERKDKNTVYYIEETNTYTNTSDTFDIDKNGNFVIKNYDDLCKMAELVNSGRDRFVNGRYILADDIDCSGNAWSTSIGTTDNPFKGIFDGNGHAIKNLTLFTSGLFGCVEGAEDETDSAEGETGDTENKTKSAEIKNLKLNLTDDSCANSQYAGAICGVLNNGKISNCAVTGSLVGAGFLGGMVGKAENSTIEKCISDIYLSDDKAGNVIGGVCAAVASTTITDCAYVNRIHLDGSSAFVGGIVAIFAGLSSTNNSYFYGQIEASKGNGNIINAICPSSSYEIVDNCYYIDSFNGDHKQAGKPMTEDQFKSGEVAYLLNGGKTDGTQAWYQNLDNGLTPDDYPVLVNNGKNAVHEKGNNSGEYSNFSEIFDTDKAGNFIIRNYDDLCKMSDAINGGAYECINGSYILEEYINCPEQNWSFSIGTTKYPFKGKFDGNGYTINNLTLNTSGLFGEADGAEIKNLNLNLSDDSVINSEKPYESVGAICATMKKGTISNCYVNGKLNSNANRLGGIVGKAENSTIEKCMSDIQLIGEGENSAVGGVCGEIFYTDITDCAFVDEIKTTTGTAVVGGIVGVGEDESTIQKSYVYGQLSAANISNARVICGNNKGKIDANSCYYTERLWSIEEASSQGTEMYDAQFKSGEVAYLLNEGITDATQAWYQNLDNGLIPDNYPVLVNNYKNTVYKNREAYNNTLRVPVTIDTIINEGTIELSDDNPLQGEIVDITINIPETYYIKEVTVKHRTTGKKETISKDIFDTTCKLSHKFNDDVIVEVVAKPILDVDEKDNFIIRNYDDLCKMAELVNSGREIYVNGNYVLEKDIDCSGEWRTPIGTTDSPFKGKFNGNGNAINNLILVTSGLFGYVDGDGIDDYRAEIQNLKLNLSEYSSIYSDYAVGAICGVLNNGKISNCSVNGRLSDNGDANRLGGIVGKTEGESLIEKCMSDIRLDVFGENSVVGGICGEISGNTIVMDCAYVNTICTLVSAPLVGGIVGSGDSSEILNSYFYGQFEDAAPYFDAICGSGKALVVNCYYIDSYDSNSGAKPMTAEQFKSGEVAKLLQGNREELVWGQDIGVDEYPVINGNVVPDVIMGDVNGDRVVTIVDATMIQKYLVNRAKFTDLQRYVADVNGDNSIDVADATKIQKMIAKLDV